MAYEKADYSARLRIEPPLDQSTLLRRFSSVPFNELCEKMNCTVQYESEAVKFFIQFSEVTVQARYCHGFANGKLTVTNFKGLRMLEVVLNLLELLIDCKRLRSSVKFCYFEMYSKICYDFVISHMDFSKVKQSWRGLFDFRTSSNEITDTIEIVDRIHKYSGEIFIHHGGQNAHFKAESSGDDPVLGVKKMLNVIDMFMGAKIDRSKLDI